MKKKRAKEHKEFKLKKGEFDKGILAIEKIVKTL